jgi:hypothetical protein
LTVELAVDKTPTGISAVVQPGNDLATAVLDLTAVLEGLVADRFEVILVSHGLPTDVADLKVRAPHLPLRVVEGDSVAEGCEAARYDLMCVAAGDGQYDVRELNHLLDAIEAGADMAAGYRPRRMDGLMRQFQRWGWKVDLDCAFALLRRDVWQSLSAMPGKPWCCAALLASARQRGYRVAEVPVSHRRPSIGIPTATRAA